MEGTDFSRVCKASKAVAYGSGQYMPILQNVKVSNTLSGILLESTNLNSYLKCWINSENYDEDKSIFIDGKQLSESVKGLKGEIDLVIDEDTLTFNYLDLCKSDAKEDDWPAFPETAIIKEIKTWTGNEFKPAIKRWASIALKDTETTRLPLTGVNCQWNESGCQFITTNGYRLLIENDGDFIKTDKVNEILLPIKELKMVSAVTKAKDAVTLTISHNKNDDTVKFAKFKIFSDDVFMEYIIRAIPEQFPDYNRVIPTDAKTTFEIDSGGFSKCLSGAVGVARDETLDVKLAIEKDEMTISAESNKGNYSQSLPIVDVWHGYEFHPSNYKGTWLSEFSAFCSGDITIYWNDELHAIRIEAKTDEGTKLLYVQTPIRLEG